MLQWRGIQQSADLRHFEIRLAEGEDGEEGGGNEIRVFDGTVRHGVMAFQRAVVENGLDGGCEFSDIRSHDDDIIHCIVLRINEMQKGILQGFQFARGIEATVDGQRIVPIRQGEPFVFVRIGTADDALLDFRQQRRHGFRAR